MASWTFKSERQQIKLQDLSLLPQYFCIKPPIYLHTIEIVRRERLQAWIRILPRLCHTSSIASHTHVRPSNLQPMKCSPQHTLAAPPTFFPTPPYDPSLPNRDFFLICELCIPTVSTYYTLTRGLQRSLLGFWPSEGKNIFFTDRWCLEQSKWSEDNFPGTSLICAFFPCKRAGTGFKERR